MKNKSILYALLATFCLLFAGCKVGNVPSSQGLSDQAFLYFVSIHKYEAPVNVTIDNKTTFDANVIKEKKGTVKGNTYAVATGKRHVKVVADGKILFERDVFLSTQETKKIALP